MHDLADLGRDRIAAALGHPETWLRHVASHGDDAVEVTRRIGQHRADGGAHASVGVGVVTRANEREDLALGALEIARHQLHPDKAGGAGEEERARVSHGGARSHTRLRHA